MRAGPPLACAFFLLASSGALGEPGGPVETAVKFHEAARAHRCDEHWELYSKATQEYIREEVHRYERERSGAPQEERPKQRHCSGIGKLMRDTVRIVRMP